MKLALTFVLVTFFAFPSSASAALKTTETEVDATAAYKCKAYYHVDDATDKNPPDLFFQQGLGGLGSERDPAKGHPLAHTLLTKEKFAVANFDRPGILAKGVETKTFDAITQKDTIACAKNTLEWIAKQTTGKIFVAGVSEGAQVVLHAATSAELPGKRLVRVYSISTPLNEWKDVAKNSCENEAQFKFLCLAVENGGILTATLRKQTGAAPLYWRTLFKADSGDKQVRDLLTATKAAIPLTFVHGTKDTITPVRPIEQLESDLKDESLKTKARVDFIYYKGGHGTDAALEKDLVTRLRNEAN